MKIKQEVRKARQSKMLRRALGSEHVVAVWPTGEPYISQAEFIGGPLQGTRAAVVMVPREADVGELARHFAMLRDAMADGDDDIVDDDMADADEAL